MVVGLWLCRVEKGQPSHREYPPCMEQAGKKQTAGSHIGEYRAGRSGSQPCRSGPPARFQRIGGQGALLQPGTPLKKRKEKKKDSGERLGTGKELGWSIL
ncbi:hypothetical protein NDU88_000495 [Pleurodeles waltl]|uniref:Uncharacterized protein n=1 Tax=Pleurodeles waltl TaxID=8319 RepID=A0AAV7S766_PLEWA|nr:hypothetical protein NDU88_000495 [Pleurodeles waltl]